MRFLVDAQLPTALARWLVARGHLAEHVSDVMLAASSDLSIWRHAEVVGTVIVTKDQDFPSRRATEPAGPQIVRCRCGNTRRRELMSWFEQHLPMLLTALERGESVVGLR